MCLTHIDCANCGKYVPCTILCNCPVWKLLDIRPWEEIKDLAGQCPHVECGNFQMCFKCDGYLCFDCDTICPKCDNYHCRNHCEK